MLGKIWELIDGKKTYLLTFIAIIVTGLWQLGYLTDKGYESAVAILVSLGCAAIRHGISKVGNDN